MSKRIEIEAKALIVMLEDATLALKAIKSAVKAQKERDPQWLAESIALNDVEYSVTALARAWGDLEEIRWQE